MRFDIGIKNFGKISDATIKVRPFTVIAGKNSSGKSFITKSLYSFFSTINTDHVTRKAYDYISKLKSVAEYLEEETNRLSKKEINLFEKLSVSILTLEHMIDQTFGSNTFSTQLMKSHQLKEPISFLESCFTELFNEISTKQKFNSKENDFKYLKSLIDDLNQLFISPTDCLVQGIDKNFTNALKENFQVSSLNELKNFNLDEPSIHFDFDSLGKVDITGESLEFSLDKKSIDSIQKLHNVVYLESPVYWKIKGALENVKSHTKRFSLGMLHNKVGVLTGVPKHFYDLTDLLSTQTTAPSIELYEELNSAIGGEVSISKSGELTYSENGSEFHVNLHNTALGITNLGIISLLLKKGVLSKGSFLFIDEPEVHLHPSWQKTMTDTLYALSKVDVNVVIASHSVDMMKCIENIMNKLPSDELHNHFGINQLNSKGESVQDSGYPLKQLAAIKADLGEPFYEMMMDNNFDWDE